MDAAYRGQVAEEWLQDVVQAALVVALPEGAECQMSLVITGDETVKSLNRDYRGLDEVTDVLSFSASHSGHWEGEAVPDNGPQSREQHGCREQGHQETDFVYPPGEPAPLGDVVISYPQTQRQATGRGVPLDQELALLIVHGVLHLAGYDHLEPDEETEMQAKERLALKGIRELNK